MKSKDKEIDRLKALLEDNKIDKDVKKSILARIEMLKNKTIVRK